MSARFIRPAICAVLSCVILVSTSGCAKVKSIRAYGECSGKASKGGECKVGAEMIWEGDRSGKMMSIFSLLQGLAVVPDAAQFELDTTGSTIPYPADGWVTLRLVDTSSGAVRSTGRFKWRRAGAIIKLSAPDAVNSWVYSSTGGGDSLTYEFDAFTSNYSSGPQTIAGKAKYEGATHASYTTTFSSGGCGTHNSPQPCPIE